MLLRSLYYARDLKFGEFYLLDSLQSTMARREIALETEGQGPGGHGAGVSTTDSSLEGQAEGDPVGWSPAQPCQTGRNA